MNKPDQSQISISVWMTCVFIIVMIEPYGLKRIIASEIPPDVTKQSNAPLYWLVTIVGGSIIVTLLYVGWKKYRADHQQRDKDKNS